MRISIQHSATALGHPYLASARKIAGTGLVHSRIVSAAFIEGIQLNARFVRALGAGIELWIAQAAMPSPGPRTNDKAAPASTCVYGYQITPLSLPIGQAGSL